MKKFRIEKEHQRMKISQYLREVQNYSGRSLRNVEVFLNGKQVRLTKKLPSHGNLRVVEKKKGTDIKPIKLPLDIIFRLFVKCEIEKSSIPLRDSKLNKLFQVIDFFYPIG